MQNIYRERRNLSTFGSAFGSAGNQAGQGRMECVSRIRHLSHFVCDHAFPRIATPWPSGNRAWPTQ